MIRSSTKCWNTNDQIRPSDPSTDLNPLIMFRSQLNGRKLFNEGNGGHLYLTYDGGTPTDVSKMIRFSDSSFHQKCLWVMMVQLNQHLELEFPSTEYFKRWLRSGSMVSSSRLGSGSLGYLKIVGQHQTRNLKLVVRLVLHTD